ncbi:IS3 family transposase [Legionella genomosp. 1]|uniref:IS3 family transposase n=1 Tax=Legionella genomosp. 1 TaxID=1093625 RepID=UPI001054E1DE
MWQTAPTLKNCLLILLHYRKNCHNKPVDPQHQYMLDFVKEIADKSGFSYGSRRMQRALNALGYPVGRGKTRSLIQEANVIVRYRKKYKANSSKILCPQLPVTVFLLM